MNLDLIDEINIIWRQIVHALKRATKPILENHDLNRVDSSILMVLSLHPNITKAELAEKLSFTPSSLTRSLDRMVSLNYVERCSDEQDSRYIRLSLSSSGKSIKTKYQNAMRAVWKDALSDISNKEQIELLNILRTLKTTLYDEPTHE
jgi:DNA-binding MarR family transcriptional regulator